jgi:hypothetical protein
MLLVLTAVVSAPLFASSASVLRLKGYIPQNTTIVAAGESVRIASNADNFSYSVVDGAEARLLYVTTN